MKEHPHGNRLRSEDARVHSARTRPWPARRLHLIEHLPELFDFVRCQAIVTYEGQEQRRRGAVAELLGQLAQTAAEKVFARDSRPIDVGWAALIAADVAFRFEALEQRLHRGIGPATALLLQNGVDFAHRAGRAL